MENDLRRLLNEFLEETSRYRQEKVSTQLTDKMPEGYKYVIREATLKDLIDWLNKDIDLEV